MWFSVKSAFTYSRVFARCTGKSYSMVGYGEDRGIVPQAMEEMFTRIANNKDKNIKMMVEASMMEVSRDE